MSKLLNNKRVGYWVANQICNGDKIKKRKQLRKLKKKQRKAQMIKTYGMARYYLAWWFGLWVLTAGKKDVSNNYTLEESTPEKPYYKFYLSEKIAAGYAKRLQGKYKQIKVIRVYDEAQKPIGYVLNAAEKI